MNIINIIVFGLGTFSQFVASVLEIDPKYKVVAHAADNKYIKNALGIDKKLVDFAKLGREYNSDEYSLIVPVGWVGANSVRQTKCAEGKAMGYSLLSYVSSRASIWPNTSIGENVLIFEGAIVQPFVQLADNIIIRSGANIGHHSVVQSNVFIASGVVTGGNVTIEENAFIGLGAIIRDNVRIGARCFIGAGAVITADTEPDGVYVGVPARRVPGKTSLDVTA